MKKPIIITLMLFAYSNIESISINQSFPSINLSAKVNHVIDIQNNISLTVSNGSITPKSIDNLSIEDHDKLFISFSKKEISKVVDFLNSLNEKPNQQKSSFLDSSIKKPKNPFLKEKIETPKPFEKKVEKIAKPIDEPRKLLEQIKESKIQNNEKQQEPDFLPMSQSNIMKDDINANIDASRVKKRSDNKMFFTAPLEKYINYKPQVKMYGDKEKADSKDHAKFNYNNHNLTKNNQNSPLQESLDKNSNTTLKKKNYFYDEDYEDQQKNVDESSEYDEYDDDYEYDNDYNDEEDY